MQLNTFLKTISLSIALLSPALANLTAGPLTLDNYWIRPGISSQNTSAYMTINNPTLAKDKLLKVACDVCATTEMHNHLNENGIMKMRPVDSIEIEGPNVELKPGNLHIMLMGLKKDLKDGDTVKLHLTFEKAGEVDVEFPVGKRAERMS